MTTTNDERDDQQRDQPARFKPGDEVWVRGTVVESATPVQIAIEVKHRNCGLYLFFDVDDTDAVRRADNHDN